MYIVHLWVCICIDQLRGCPSTRKLPKLISSSQYDNSPHYYAQAENVCMYAVYTVHVYVCMHAQGYESGWDASMGHSV